MTEHPMVQFADSLVALAEGRTEPDDWLAWWSAHESQVASVCPPGWLLRLLPRGGGEPGNLLWTLRAVATSQAGACYVLAKLGVQATRSARYTTAYEAEFARWEHAERASVQWRSTELTPLIDGLATDFPALAGFLRRHWDQIERIEPGASPAELIQLARTVGMELPAAYLRFLSHTRVLVVGDTLQLSAHHPFVHTSTKVELPTEGMLCFGEYWLEADGDQVLFDLRNGTVDDPPVLYYAHDRRTVEQAAESFTSWVASLPHALA